MIPLGLDHPLVLFALPLALLPFVLPALRRSAHPYTRHASLDRASRAASVFLPLAGSAAIALLVLAAAGLHRTDEVVQRQGRGAHLMLLIDRSFSMDNTFANDRPDGQEESKAAAARRLLTDFVERRPHDQVGVAMFSTSPMLAVPLTDHHEIVKAAIATMERAGLVQTNVGLGLALAIDAFDERSQAASRAVLLVSDGAGVISREVQAKLRDTIARAPVNLYWLFLRTEGAKGIFDVPEPGERDTPQTRPERHLHLFLQGLGVPYRAFEAGDPQAVEDAIAEIEQLEDQPITYEETLPRSDLDRALVGIAAVLIGLLTLVKLFERGLVAPTGRLAPPFRSRVRS